MMMLKVKLVSLLCFGVLCMQAQAQTQQALSEADAQANAANKELLLKGGKISPRQKAELVKAEKADANQQGTVNYLAANKVKPGVVTLASGVQYKVLKAGAGKRPTDANSVRCRYQGTLVDGTGFDKADDKAPTVLRVAGMLPGLQEAVKLMPVGAKWEVVVPPELAYGAKGNHGVGPNAVLIYVIEIAGIV
jgi:FKBP-type peptidyl-prolyl cis-trans isomerase FklB